MTKNFDDYTITKVRGLDMEKEDRDVGIFGNDFILCLEIEGDRVLQLHFDDDKMDDLLRILEVHYAEKKSQEEIDISDWANVPKNDKPIDVLTDEDIEICSICKKEYEGFGNNAMPINKGRCCDACNLTKVIPARLGEFKHG